MDTPQSELTLASLPAADALPDFRPYQDEIHHAVIDAIREGHKRILVQLPTGGGKTHIGARFMRGATAKANRSIFLAPRRELVYQAAARLLKFGVTSGLIMSGEKEHLHRLAQVGSFDTINARVIRSSKIELANVRIVVVDEAHLSIAETRKRIIDSFGNDAIVIGLSATPARGDGKPLGDIFTKMITGWSVRRMIDEGYLVDTKYFAPSKPDLRAVKVRKGDYDVGELEVIMTKPKIIGDVVDNWFKIAEGLPTVVFCVTRAHARFVTEEFRSRGVAADYVDGETNPDEREAIFERVESGKTTVLVNVFVASYGLDIPRLQVCQIARPTKSLVLYIQMAGRTLRPVYADGFDLNETDGRLDAIATSDKPYSILIDHAGAIDMHGQLDEPMPWTLDGDESISDVKERERKEKKEPKDITCPRCKAVFKGTRHCPSCGFELIPPGAAVPYHAADLVEKIAEGRAANKKTDWPTKIKLYGELRGYARSKGYKDGFAANFYRDIMGVWPNDARLQSAQPSKPTELLSGYIKWRAIRSKHNAAKN